MSLFKTRSIMFQVLAPSLSLVILSFLAVGAVTAWSRAAGTSEMFHRKVELTASLSQDSVTSALWLLDDAAMSNALAPVVNDADTAFVWIRGVEGKTYYADGPPELETAAARALKRAGPEHVTFSEGSYLYSLTPLHRTEAGHTRPLGHLVIVYDTHAVKAEVWTAVAWVVGVGVVATLLIVALLVVLMRRIAKPLDCLAAAMTSLSAGRLETAVHNLERNDEIGAMARSVQVFKDNALQLQAAQAESARLMEERARAEAASQAKSEFLAHMSHELRTPLNGVLSMAQLMARGHMEDDQREKLDIILMSGRDLLHVINDVLDFSKIEAGKLELEKAPFRIDEVLQGVESSFRAVADRKGLALRLNIDREAAGWRLGDAARLRQIVSNFVSNAVKFTAAGEVEIRAEGLGEAGRQGLRIAVRDTGIGIPPERMCALFQKFSQVDASTTRKYGGTGLGLAICRELAVQMGGEAWAESTPGEGSTFYVTLAMPSCARPEAAAEEAALEEGAAERTLRILAAEDNPTNQIVLRSIMAAFGFDLSLAGNGREAVEAWSAGGFDLILMDVQMPEMDGLEATRTIRRMEAERGLGHTPIVALTANAFRHQIDEYVEAGMDDHLAKPIDVAALQLVLERVLSGEEADQTRAAQRKAS